MEARHGGGQHRGGRHHGLSGQVRPFLKEGGLFLCSGIIDDRAEEVARHLREAGWDILRTRQSEGWFSYLCR